MERGGPEGFFSRSIQDGHFVNLHGLLQSAWVLAVGSFHGLGSTAVWRAGVMWPRVDIRVLVDYATHCSLLFYQSGGL
jgi:hypothetical protein